MRREAGIGIDWRDGAAYAPLLGADRSLFAWEWLRRDIHYQAAAERALPVRGERSRGNADAAAFGLVAFESPGLGVPHARPVWRSGIHPQVLAVECGPGGDIGDSFALDRWSAIATLLTDDRGEHLLLSDGLRAIRLDARRGTFTEGPVLLRYRIEGLKRAEAKILTLRRLLTLCRTGRFSRSLHHREPRARRWILTLRACDALVAGADQRQIAEALFSRSAAESGWRTRESSVRSQVQRLVRTARAFAAGAYRASML